MRTLAHYVQELAACAISLRWPAEVREKVTRLAAMVELVLADAAIEFATIR